MKSRANCTYIEDTMEMSLQELTDIYDSAYSQGYRDAREKVLNPYLVIRMRKKHPPIEKMNSKTPRLKGTDDSFF